MENKEPEFAYEKQIGISEHCYGNIPFMQDCIGRLLICMQETNKIHGLKCEFFRLDFRQPYFGEQFLFPIGSIILDLKWGSKKELEQIQHDLKKNDLETIIKDYE